MPAYRVNIDGRVYEGHYGYPTLAVYGAMLIDDNLLYEQDCDEWLRIHRSGAAMLIGVEPVTDHFVAKKCHRVDVPAITSAMVDRTKFLSPKQGPT